MLECNTGTDCEYCSGCDSQLEKVNAGNINEEDNWKNDYSELATASAQGEIP